jgi:hypothetical protein
MLFFLKRNSPYCGKMLTVTSVQSCDDRISENNSAAKHRQMQEPNPGKSFTILCRLLALLLALAVGPAAVVAQESDNNQDRDHERDQANDPTGAWLVTNTDTSNGNVLLSVELFTKDGGWIGSIQGEAACCPILSSGFGTWVRTGPRTFVITFASFSYDQNGILVSTNKGRRSLTLTPIQEIIGKGHFTITFPDGSVIVPPDLTFVGKRVNAEPSP